MLLLIITVSLGVQQSRSNEAVKAVLNGSNNRGESGATMTSGDIFARDMYTKPDTQDWHFLGTNSIGSNLQFQPSINNNADSSSITITRDNYQSSRARERNNNRDLERAALLPEYARRRHFVRINNTSDNRGRSVS